MADQPGYTRVPNDLIDAMGGLGNAELRILLAIARKTIGWQKECDVISFSQFRQLTGLTRRNAFNAVEALVNKELITREKAGPQSYCYSIKPLPVGIQLDRIPSDTSTLGGTDLLPVGIRLDEKPLPLRTTQKKDLKQKKEKGVRARAERTPPTRQVNLDSLHEAVTIYRQLTNIRPPPTTETLIASTVVDMPAWQQAVKAWCDRGFKPGNVAGMIDWYLHPEKQQRGNTNGKPLRPSLNGHSERGKLREADTEHGF